MDSPASRVRTYEWLVPAVALAFLAAIMGWDGIRDYYKTVEQEYRLLESRAKIVDAQINGILHGTDLLLRELARERARLRPDGSDGFQAGLSRQLLSIPEARSLFFADARGRIEISSDARLLGFDVSGREYFRRAQDDPEPRMTVSRPFVGATNVLIVIASRPVRDAQGRFIGLAGASFNPKYFEEILGSMQDGPTGSSLIINTAGDILYAAPQPERFAGKSLAGGPGYTAHLAQDQPMTRHRATAKISGVEKISVFRRSGDSGLIVVVSQDADAVFGPLRNSLAVRVAAFLVVLLVVLYLSRLAYRQRRGQLAAEARMRALIEASPLPMLVAEGEEQRVAFFNSMFSKIIGYGPDEVPDVAHWWPLAYPDPAYRQQIMDTWARRFEEARQHQSAVLPVEAVIRCKNGDDRVFDVHLTRIGPLSLVVFVDFTEQRRAETALRNSEAQLRLAATVFENSREGVLITDLDRNIISANPAFCEITGYALEEIVGKNPRILQSGRQDAAYYRAMWESVDARGYWSGEIWNRRKNGEIYPELLGIAAVKDRLGKPVHYIGVFTDISELKRSEAEIRRLNDDLERRVRERTAELENSNRELESFSYSVSHDLRGPLRAIDGFSHVIAEEFGAALGEAGHSYLQRIRNASQRMGILIDNLLDLAQVSRHELRHQEADLSRVVAELAQKLDGSSHGRSVAWVIQPGLIVQGDPVLLKMALNNLLHNAWKFTARGSAPRIEFGCDKTNGTATYFIRDNGAGIDMTYADKLFQPFQRLHDPREFEGTGIGLAIVRRIVSRHGGSLRVESALGQGATFFFTLG